MIFDKHLVNIAKGTMDPTSAEKAENPNKLTGSKIGAIFGKLPHESPEKFENQAPREFSVRALFLTFPHEKNTFQRSKVVSEAIFPTN